MKTKSTFLCFKCKKDFPEKLVYPLSIEENYYDFCGICALEIMRQIYNKKDYQFPSDSLARSLYKETKLFLSKSNGKEINQKEKVKN